MQTQSVMLSLPAREKVCLGQISHQVPAVLFENLPAGQTEHAPVPFAGLNLPATHALQAPFKMRLPWKEAHDSKYERLRWLALLMLLALAYITASLSISEEIAPVYPALHKHCAGDADPGRESECSGQVWHVLSSSAAVLDEYLP